MWVSIGQDPENPPISQVHISSKILARDAPRPNRASLKAAGSTDFDGGGHIHNQKYVSIPSSSPKIRQPRVQPRANCAPTGSPSRDPEGQYNEWDQHGTPMKGCSAAKRKHPAPHRHTAMEHPAPDCDLLREEGQCSLVLRRVPVTLPVRTISRQIVSPREHLAPHRNHLREETQCFHVPPVCTIVVLWGRPAPPQGHMRMSCTCSPS